VRNIKKMRIGHGYDVHQFGGEGPMVLGGVTIQYPQGLLAHSDGDVLIHAICDALLGALGLGDIGHWFPDTSAQWSGVDSRILLSEVANKMRQQNYQLTNCDATIIAQSPKMAPHIQNMRENIADTLGCGVDQINIKVTTTENLGFIGRKEGIAVHSVVLIQCIADRKP